MKLLVYMHVHLHTYTLGEALVPFKSTSSGSVDFTTKVALILHLALCFTQTAQICAEYFCNTEKKKEVLINSYMAIFI